MIDRRQAGIDGERAGADFLVRRGWTILERNFRTPYGEIDLIARDGDTLVFVEVKRRGSLSFGSPQEAVNRRKQERIVRSALQYVKAKRPRASSFRFDVLALGPGENALELISPAFDADGYTF